MEKFSKYLFDSLLNQSFVKMTLSKTYSKSGELKNVYVRKVFIKDENRYSFTYRYETNDQVKNYTKDEAITVVEILLKKTFKSATLFLEKETIFFQQSKKDKYLIRKEKIENETMDTSHDKQKIKRVSLDRPYLRYLGVSTKEGQLVPSMADKYRQINKFLEIIEGLIPKNTSTPFTVIDMGSGKGYLTFALYDYLVNVLQVKAQVLGVELRESLVNQCNAIAKDCDFKGLSFEADYIQNIEVAELNMLIALHACDTATDDALYKAITAKADIVVCAPCCHKQVRQQLKGISFEDPLLKHGIYKERTFEMVTDTIRALLLQDNQYKTKVFEFISSEHTHKNVMIVGEKSKEKLTRTNEKIAEIKSRYKIKSQYLEELLNRE